MMQMNHALAGEGHAAACMLSATAAKAGQAGQAHLAACASACGATLQQQRDALLVGALRRWSWGWELVPQLSMARGC